MKCLLRNKIPKNGKIICKLSIGKCFGEEDAAWAKLREDKERSLILLNTTYGNVSYPLLNRLFMSKTPGLIVFILAILLIIISIRSASPPSVRTGPIPDSSFSVPRAYAHLLQISRAPHSIGTAENVRVREYIASTCKALGFETTIQNTVSVNNFRGNVVAANVFDIIAYKKGLHSSKAVVLMAHYDSQINTPGAGDDGAGVAAILETARALQKTALQNDLILLITDGEEMGLMGANAFVKESPLLNHVGIIINFEGRGNSGPSNMFEVNAQNGWAINEYAKSVAHPFANSLGYEIYKKLPNNTDYTLFKDAGITGLNNAYIDGFVNYHSANDKPENLDLRSLQHHGDNMLSLVKHFGNLNITDTKAPDICYFNLIGGWFVHYPASWNLIFVILADLLFILYLVAGLRSKNITLGGFIIGTFLFPLVLAIIFFVGNYMLKGILSWYPVYRNFGENNSYNSGWYFLAMSALATTLFSFIYFFASKKIQANSLLAGILLIVVILTNVMQYAVPSASYILFIPLLFILAIRLLLIRKNSEDDDSSFKAGLLNLLSVVPAIFILAPTIHFTFIAFGLGNNMPFVTVVAGLLAALLLPVFYPVFKRQKLLIPLCSFLLFLAALAGGHFSAGYSEKYPLQVNVGYLLDADSAKAIWFSNTPSTDQWSQQFFKGKSISKTFVKDKARLKNDAPIVQLPAPSALVLKDTLQNGKRALSVHFAPGRENVVNMGISISDSITIDKVTISGNEINGMKDNKPYHYSINYTGMTSDGFDILFEIDASKKLEITVHAKSVGLPAINGFNTTYSKNIIPGSYYNTLEVRKHFVL